VQISVLEEGVHDALQCVVTAQLQHEPSFVIYVSLTMLGNHILPRPKVVSNVCLEVFQNDRAFVSFKPSQDITSILREFQVLCT